MRRAALCSIVFLAGCGGSSAPELPNVVLIVMDTVRADHVSTGGYARRTTPALEGLAAEATVFENAISTAPWTLPAHASMFTGLYPFQHGAHTVLVDESRSTARPLPMEATTLAEALKSEGYATGALVANTVFLAPKLQLDQGFDSYVVKRGRARQLGRAATAFLDERKERPFFLFLNYMDAHRPYDSRARAGLLDADPGTDSAELLDELYGPVLGGEVGREDPRMQRLVDQYDTAIANLDEALGELFDELRARGMWDNTLVIVTSDHGEYFGEHALIEHSKDIYQPALAVPLIVKRPGQASAAREARPISLAELPSLVAGSLPGSAGDRLGGLFDGAHPVLAENYYSRTRDLEYERFRRVRRSLQVGELKLITSSVGDDELYALGSDPDELQDLAGERAERLSALGAALSGLLERRSGFQAGEGLEWTEEEQRLQHDLGY